MIDTVVVGDDFHSGIVEMLALTRSPFIAVEHRTDNAKLSSPHVMTAGGVVFGLPAIVDFLLNRVTEPPLLHPDIKRRCLQTTVFWALAQREFERVYSATPSELTQWLRNLDDQLRAGKFYTGDEFTLCDIALVNLLTFIELQGTKLPAAHIAYADRCAAHVAHIVDKNTQVSTHDD